MRAIDADALEELFREVIGGIAKKPEMNGNLEHMVRASAMVIEMIQDAPTIEPDPDTVSRPAIYDALGDTRAFYFDSDNGMVQATKDQTGFEGWYKVHDVFKTIDNLPPSPIPSRPHIASLETPCDYCDVADKCTYESSCPHEAIWKAEHEGGAL